MHLRHKPITTQSGKAIILLARKYCLRIRGANSLFDEANMTSVKSKDMIQRPWKRVPDYAWEFFP